MSDLWETLMGAGQGFANGARSFGDQAKWSVGAYGEAPRPAAYAGGPDYPAKDDANAYVRNNWPGDGRHAFHVTRPETFYTPEGMKPPAGGREPTTGEFLNNPVTISKMLPFLMSLMQERGNR